MQIHPADFSANVKNVILHGEGNRDTPYFDRNEIPGAKATIGYGFNLEVRDNLRIVLYEQNILQGMSTATIESTLTQYLNEIQLAKTTPLPQGMVSGSDAARIYLNGVLAQRLNTLTQTTTANQVTAFQTQTSDADAIFNDIIWGVTIAGHVIKGTVELLDARLGNTVLTTVLPHDSNEYLALTSLFYNAPSRVTSELVNAIQTDHRADAWFLIRYQSNGQIGTSLGPGIASRRYAESDLFGLFENTQSGEVEAKSILQMYTAHRETILRYEHDFPPSAAISRTFHDESFVARNLLLTNYAQFAGAPSIDGEVLVGSALRDTFDLQPVSIPGVPAHVFDLSKNDLMLGEGEDDFLRGRGGIDVLYGGSGDDRLVGDAGNDYLFGGEGFDTYVWAGGDGHDRIEDSDADGVIFVNGQMLVGGVKKSGQTDWVSADGTIRYEMSGTDLVVKLNGTQILTVNEDFQSGQFGIHFDRSGQADVRRAMERIAA